MLQGMREASEKGEAQIMLLPHVSFKGWEKADGVLLCDYVSSEVLQQLPPELPCTFLITPLPGMAGVSADDYSGGRLATEHLLELGHRRIAYLHSNDQVLVPQRQAGYEDALKAAGITPEKRWTRQLSRAYDFDYGPDFVQVGRESVRHWLSEDWRKTGCTALLAHNDETAIGAMEAFHAAGLNVPRDVSIIGFDGVEIGAYSSPRLTTIEIPLRRMGQIATELLLDQISSSSRMPARAFEHRVLPVQLKVRESTAPPRV
jgi:DNA-binding LacI/PurR family transcriptional regulator